MAWRIAEHVIRGEIDNRTRGRVTGRIWFAGRPEPIELNLTGNAWRDLAGRRLEFVNDAPKPGLPGGLAATQHGATGDITASRKVKVPEIPLDRIGEYDAARKSWPWHWGNSLYLEWFSRTNGRVVIESAAYQLILSPDITWDMTPDEETAQRGQNAATLGGFIEQLAEAAPTRAEDDHRPLTEAEADQQQAESDKLIDRVMARMEREGEDADYDRILDEELERARRERNEPEPTPEQEAEQARRMEEMDAAAIEAEERERSESWKQASDTARDAFKDKHPLAAQAFALSVRLMREPRDHDWIPQDAMPEHPLVELITSIAKAGAKLAGALNRRGDWPPPLEVCASVLVRLKKAAGYLDDALLAASSCHDEQLTDHIWLADVVRETTAIADATNALIAELRDRLGNGE